MVDRPPQNQLFWALIYWMLSQN